MKTHSREVPLHENCRACGTNPRANEENPRAEHPEFYKRKSVPKWLKIWDRSKGFNTK
ncbi:MAG: hypothetical protein WC477_05510 [Patescibacteria group bacterium]